MEETNLNAPETKEGVVSPQQIKIDPEKYYSASRIIVNGWLPWMKMGGRVGVVVFSTVGKRIDSIDDLSEPLRSEIRTNYTAYLAPPPIDDSRPNETSWTHIKKIIDARRSADKK